MATIEGKRALLKFLAAGLTIGCTGLLGCSAISRFNNRMVRLAAPQQLARSAGGSYATTDAYLRRLEIPSPSEKVVAAVSQLPENDAILFVAPAREPETELVYRVIASLSWPREVGALHCGLSSEQTELLFQPRAGKKIRWLMFYRTTLPAGLNSPIEIGQHLKLIPIEEAREWTFYCSQ